MTVIVIRLLADGVLKVFFGILRNLSLNFKIAGSVTVV
jgi:hypothetical protein